MPRSIAILVLLLAGNLHAQERWYALYLGDQRAGWTHTSLLSDEQRCTTVSHIHLEMRRGAVVLRMDVRSEFVETLEGKPLSALTEQTLGTIKSTTRVKFEGEQLVIEQQQGAQVSTRTQPAAKSDWLPPAAAQRFVQAQIKAGKKRVEYRTLDPTAGLEPFAVAAVHRAEEDVEIMGRVVRAQVWEQTTEQLPGLTMCSHLDEAGWPLRSSVPLAGSGLTLTMLATDRALAQSPLNPPELLASTLVPLGQPIAEARSLRRAVFELRFKNPVAAKHIHRGGPQRVEHVDDTVRVTVDLDQPVAATDDPPDEAHRATSGMLNHEDPEISALAAKALFEAPKSDAERAEALRRFVRSFVTRKDLSVGFATASEVARTRQGDCSEHAVLLAALLRAAKIPSRTVSGLVYVEEFLDQDHALGYHMWTQAWITDQKDQGRWVDLDATLDVAFDATHIALHVSAMEGWTLLPNDMISLLSTVGQLEAKVIEPAP